MEILLCLILITQICTFAKAEELRTNYDEDIKEFPFVVSLRKNEKHFCGGSILSSTFILTAGQCICDDEDDFGNYSIQYFSTKPVKLERVICHPDYHQYYMMGIDIAIVKLKHEIPADTWKPVVLATEEDLVYNIYAGLKDITLVGFGNTSNGEIPGRLQKINVEIFKDSLCDELFNFDNFFCGRTKNKGILHMGDFGSPLTRNGVLIGILIVASNLHNVDELGLPLPIGFTRIAAYETWIKDNSNYVS